MENYRMSDTTTSSEESIEESLNAIILETMPSQQQYYMNDDYFDIDIDEILNVTSPQETHQQHRRNRRRRH